MEGEKERDGVERKIKKDRMKRERERDGVELQKITMALVPELAERKSDCRQVLDTH